MGENSPSQSQVSPSHLHFPPEKLKKWQNSHFLGKNKQNFPKMHAQNNLSNLTYPLEPANPPLYIAIVLASPLRCHMQEYA
jgi:hypothetical protein